MLPNLDINDGLGFDFEIQEQPSYTPKIDFERGRIVGHTDGLEAIKQTIYLILNTERYEYQIYSWNYGSEIKRLIGKREEFVVPELKRLVKEALMQDTRITNLSNFKIDYNQMNGTLSFEVDVETVYGEVRSKFEEVGD